MKSGLFYSVRKTLLGAFLAVSLLAGANSAHAALGIDFGGAIASGGYVDNGGPGSFGAATGYSIVGWSFSPTIDLYVTRLGVYDADRDRLHSELHQVGLWLAGNPSTPITTVSINEVTGNVPETSPQGAKFHFVDTAAPVLLKKGQIYYVGSTMYAGNVTAGASTADFDSFAAFNNSVATPATINPYITYLGSAYAINGTNSLIMPTLTNYGTQFTVGANIDVIPTPIPAAACLLGSGLLGLVGVRRRKM